MPIAALASVHLRGSSARPPDAARHDRADRTDAAAVRKTVEEMSFIPL